MNTYFRVFDQQKNWEAWYTYMLVTIARSTNNERINSVIANSLYLQQENKPLVVVRRLY